MEVYRDISENIVESKSVVTIGNFDGVHLGHQEILKSVKRNAKKVFLLAQLYFLFIHHLL